MHASGHSRVTLAALAHFAAHNRLSTLLNARRVPASALNVQHLHALAVAISSREGARSIRRQPDLTSSHAGKPGEFVDAAKTLNDK